MIAALVIALILYLLCCRPQRANLVQTGEYMSLERTTMLNGIMIVAVVVRHGCGYVKDPDLWNGFNWFCYHELLRSIGQLHVAGFLFYSGFGIMESISRKGVSYLNSFPRMRFLKILVHLDIAVLCFLLVNWLLGTTYPWSTALPAFVGWTSVGNSHWYICAILMLYVITFGIFRALIPFRWGRGASILLMWVAVIIMAFSLRSADKPDYWWNTLLCFPAGMTLSLYHEQVKRGLARCKVPASVLGTILVVLALAGDNLVKSSNIWFWNLWAIMAGYGIALMLSGVRFRKSPRFLLWMGGALFSIYIFHRIPMRVFSRLDLLMDSPQLFLLASLLIALLIALVTERVFKWVDKLCFRKS